MVSYQIVVSLTMKAPLLAAKAGPEIFVNEY